MKRLLAMTLCTTSLSAMDYKDQDKTSFINCDVTAFASIPQEDLQKKPTQVFHQTLGCPKEKTLKLLALLNEKFDRKNNFADHVNAAMRQKGVQGNYYFETLRDTGKLS